MVQPLLNMRPVLAFALVVIACSTPAPTPLASNLSAPSLPPGSALGAPSARPCSSTPSEIGRLRDPQLDEISGVVESTKNPDVLFVHNDSGDSPRLFAINRAGEILAELTLETVPKLVDAEDIVIGPGPGGASFLYLGDTGNNFAGCGLGIPRRKAVVYRIPEPNIPSSARHLKVALREAFPIVLTFPKGARNIEAFFVDPPSGELFIISKDPDGDSQVLVASAAQLAGGGGPLSWLGQLQFGKPPLPGSTEPTSASASKDGRTILVRTYSSVFLFPRTPGESVMSALRRAPRRYPAPREAQGEAITFVDGETAFVTISEGIQAAVNCVSLNRNQKQ
jgi:hypothetical protein